MASPRTYFRLLKVVFQRINNDLKVYYGVSLTLVIDS